MMCTHHLRTMRGEQYRECIRCGKLWPVLRDGAAAKRVHNERRENLLTTLASRSKWRDYWERQ